MFHPGVLSDIPTWSHLMDFCSLTFLFFVIHCSSPLSPVSLVFASHSMKKDCAIPKVYYLEVVCFLTFNVASMIGNFATLKIKCPGPRIIWIPVVLRTLLIPFFMFCNYKVGRNTTWCYLIVAP